jgi:hypothetical protein
VSQSLHQNVFLLTARLRAIEMPYQNGEDKISVEDSEIFLSKMIQNNLNWQYQQKNAIDAIN